MSWVARPLGELCDVLDSKRKPITKKDRIDGEYPYYGATGILSYVDNYIFNEKLVLIGEDGAKWGAGENTAFVAEGKYWVNNHAHVIRPHRDIILDQWIIYYLNATDLSPFITGLTVPKLNQEKMRSIELPVPPLPEQNRIVAILDEAFAGIDQAIANIEKNLASARELFESTLQSFFDEARRVYATVPLSELATDITDGDHMPPPKSPSGIPFITIRNISKNTGEIDFSETFTVSKAYFDSLKPNKKPLLGDVLYTVTGSFGIPVLIKESSEFCFQRHIGLVRPKPEVDSEWLYYLLMSPQVIKQANDGATGTAQKTVSLKVLRGFQVPKVPFDIQKDTAAKFNSVIQETSALREVYERKLSALNELKQSLLQKAFSGELTSDINKLAEAAE